LSSVRSRQSNDSPLAAAAPLPAYEELVREVERALNAFVERGSVSFPMEAHLALCRA
jgi:hypothetical protein